MKKIIYQDSNEELWKNSYGRMITLLDSPKDIKTAASSSITREMLERYRPDKDHFACHIIALGDYETYGCNRNADSFPKQANIKFHKTFETNAKLYREHDSNPDHAIGEIKCSMYNPDMRRTELIVWGDKKKASYEWDKIKDGKMLTGSMGCYVKHDRDNLSGKLCKNPSEYEPWMKMAACKFITTWNVDGVEKTFNKVACVHNDEPRFVDYSFVEFPADRIAETLEYIDGEYSKVASMNKYAECVPSALLPESQLLFVPGMEFEDDIKCALFHNLVDAEKEFGSRIESSIINGKNQLDPIDDLLLNSWKSNEDIRDAEYKALLALRPSTLLHELSKRGILLPFEPFLKLFERKTDEECKSPVIIYAKNVLLPNAFSYIQQERIPIGNETLFDEGSEFDSRCDLANTKPVQDILNSLMPNFSIMESPFVNRRIIISISKNRGDSFKEPMIKMANSVIKSSENISQKDIDIANRYIANYCNYKIATLKSLINIYSVDKDLAKVLAIGQNYNFSN